MFILWDRLISSYNSSLNGFSICWWFLPKSIIVLVVVKVIADFLILLQITVLASIFLKWRALSYFRFVFEYYYYHGLSDFFNLQYNTNHYHYYSFRCLNCPNLAWCDLMEYFDNSHHFKEIKLYFLTYENIFYSSDKNIVTFVFLLIT